MSQALAIRVKALEERVRELEERMDAAPIGNEPLPPEAPDPSEQKPYMVPWHAGFGHWFAVPNTNRTRDAAVNTEALTREEAETLANEINAETESLNA